MKIKCLFLTVLLLAASSFGSAQSSSLGEEVKRLENETAESFAVRYKTPQSELAHTVIETAAWGNRKTVIAFYETNKKESGNATTQIDGYVFMLTSSDTYKKILIYSFEEEGSAPKIEAVFFANADEDKAKELIVICSWAQLHYDVSGTLYATFVFDDIPRGSNPAVLSFLEAVSDKVSGGCDCWYRDGRKGTKKYRTAAQVKAGLKKLGF